jgi:GPN-loop GTPase
MSRYGVLIMGPAGAGKSTFCTALLQHLALNRRSSYYINLDPAATSFGHPPDLDIKDLISLDDAMEELELGPNGGLLACFDYLLQNMDFLTDPLDALTDEVLMIIDMPGQIELYTHVPILPALVRELTGGMLNMRLCAVYLLEATFIVDRAKFFAGTLSAMSSMLLLGLPHVNVLSKMDLVKGMVARRELKRFFSADADLLVDDPSTAQKLEFMHDGAAAGDDDEQKRMDDEAGAVADPTASKNVMAGTSFRALNQAVARLIDDFGLVSFLQLESGDEDSVGAVLSYIDDAIQFHEAQEPREPREEEYDLDTEMD